MANIDVVNRTLELTPRGNIGDALTVIDAQSIGWAPMTGSGTVGPGTVNKIPKFTGVTAVGDSALDDAVTTAGAVSSSKPVLPTADNTLALGTTAKRWASLVLGTFASLGTNPAATGAVRLANTGAIKARNFANAADLEIIELTAANVVKLAGIWTWPATDGGASTFLQTDGGGNLSWVAAGGGVTDGGMVVNNLVLCSGAGVVNDAGVSLAAGAYNFPHHVYPTPNATLDLGSASENWNHIHVRELDSDAGVTMQAAVGQGYTLGINSVDQLRIGNTTSLGFGIESVVLFQAAGQVRFINQVDGAAGQAGTLATAPKIGNPDAWVELWRNGVQGWFPWWHA